MNVTDAETLARDLMSEFGLTADGWSFRFDTARKRFGCCKRSSDGGVREISLSRALTLSNDATEVEETLRHEIAHALAPMHASHGPRWREACKLTGARPQSCYGSEVKPARGMWRFTCDGCGVSALRGRKYGPSAYHCRGAALQWERTP